VASWWIDSAQDEQLDKRVLDVIGLVRHDAAEAEGRRARLTRERDEATAAVASNGALAIKAEQERDRERARAENFEEVHNRLADRNLALAGEAIKAEQERDQARAELAAARLSVDAVQAWDRGDAGWHDKMRTALKALRSPPPVAPHNEGKEG
jgi:uncharacterized protein (DUF4415 family)